MVKGLGTGLMGVEMLLFKMPQAAASYVILKDEGYAGCAGTNATAEENPMPSVPCRTSEVSTFRRVNSQRRVQDKHHHTDIPDLPMSVLLSNRR